MNLPRMLVVLALAGVLTGCTAPDGTGATSRSADSTPTKTAVAQGLSGDDIATETEASSAVVGVVEGGSPASINLGEPVTYFSFASISRDDVQRVTINAVDYVELADLGDDAPLAQMRTGVIVVDLTWEQVAGQVQSNQGYLDVETGGRRGTNRAFHTDRMHNGRVEEGTPKKGVYTVEIDRGPTTLTLLDYLDLPVAVLEVDTSR